MRFFHMDLYHGDNACSPPPRILILVFHLVWNKSLNVQKSSWDRTNKDSRSFLLFCLCKCWKSVTPCLGSGFCYSESLSSLRDTRQRRPLCPRYFLQRMNRLCFFESAEKACGVIRLAQTRKFPGDRYLMSCQRVFRFNACWATLAFTLQVALCCCETKTAHKWQLYISIYCTTRVRAQLYCSVSNKRSYFGYKIQLRR